MKQIWLSPPSLSKEDELEFVKKALDTNWVTTSGENINKFEKDLETYHNNLKKVTALNSGTSAIHLALILLGVKEGDEVICQSFTFCATANPILYLKANPIFIDSEEDTWNMDPNLLEDAIKNRINKRKMPKAIIVVDSYGMPAKWDEILMIANKYHIPIIEDSAEALGSEYRNKRCGLFGDFGIFSFNGNKIITTSSGGALLCNTTKQKDKVIYLASQAKKNKDYTHYNLGYNYRMSNVLAGIGRGQMRSLENKIKKKREVNQFYQKIFRNIEGIEVLKEPNNFFYSNHWLSCILVDKTKAGFSNLDLKKQFLEDKIDSRTLWNPLHLQKYFKNYEYFGGNISEQLYKKGLCLPSGANLTNIDLKRIQESVNKMIAK